ncbi:hypothetical protein [Helicobacter mesocricetorum]|uniref:hypothetical protein n=1 Tax=Helicobacter mesocricetorum TaxID=87012 RepID=UPI000CF0B57F|nr:hypothetical protein [Helicobacter mesocricetorum]
MILRMDNFLSFAIVSGFFIGLLLSFLKFDEPEMIVAGTLISTIGFYLIALLSASLCVQFFNQDPKIAQRPSYNRILEEYIEEFDKREKTTNRIRGFLRTMEKTLKEEEEENLDNTPKSKQKNTHVEDF